MCRLISGAQMSTSIARLEQLMRAQDAKRDPGPEDAAPSQTAVPAADKPESATQSHPQAVGIGQQLPPQPEPPVHGMQSAAIEALQQAHAAQQATSQTPAEQQATPPEPAVVPAQPIAQPDVAAAPQPVHKPLNLQQPQVEQLQTALKLMTVEQLHQTLCTIQPAQLANALQALLATTATACTSPGATAGDVDLADQRNAERRKMLRAAKIIYNNAMCVINCEIRDISDTGCRVKVASSHGIPDLFTLHIIAGGIRHECEVAWRKPEQMGLKFI